MIPEGYRLLTSADIGKVFGTDLESMVYFDEDVIPTFYLTSNGERNLTNFCVERRGYLPIAEEEISSSIFIYGSINDYIYFEINGFFYPVEADLSGVEITEFNTNYNWNNWMYVKDIEVNDPYNITTSKPKIVIHCEGKAMANNLVITNEIYMGEFEEISSGHTLTLMQNTTTNYAGVITSNEYAEYSLDNGNTWNKFYGLSLPLILENVSTISFRNTGVGGSSGAFTIGTTSTSSDVATLMSQQSTAITITENKTLYIGSYTGNHSGGADN